MLRCAFIPVVSLMLLLATPDVSAELTSAMIDPLGANTSPDLPADSSLYARTLQAEMLDTEGPLMADPGEDTWWNRFNDPVLSTLIRKAAESNLNLLSTLHSIEASRNSLKAIKSGYYPTVSASAMYQKGQSSGATMHGPTTSPMRENFMGLSLDVNWEIDLFGRIRKQSEAAGASYNASRADYVAALTSLCAQVASVYFDLSAARELYSTTLSHLESQQKVLAITDARLEAGISSKLDACQARTVVLDTKSSLPSLRARMEGDIDMLALLTNTDREEIAKMALASELPRCNAGMAAQLDADLLRRRPDVAAAEYQLAAAAARAGLAKKDWLPTLTLTGSVATESHAAKNLFSGNSLSYSLTPTLSWTIFDGFKRHYTIDEAKADVMAAADNYDYTVAAARREVRTARSDYASLLEEIEILDEAAAQSHESLRLSLELYKSGLADFTNVADAQISWLNYENSVVSAKYNALSTLTTLYRAMGGGWDGTLPDPDKK